MTPPGLVVRRSGRLEPDPTRVVAQLFVAGQENVGGGDSRASGVVARILALDEDEVVGALRELQGRFGHRHRDLEATFARHAERVASRVDPDAELSDERWLLLGATFTHEYSVEAVSLCNPSMVAHPDQSSTPEGSLRFVMSVRCIGEGHRSSIGFRTGTVDADGVVTVDEDPAYLSAGSAHAGLFERSAFHGRLRELGADGEDAAFVLDQMGETFTVHELDERLEMLAAQHDTRRDELATATRLRAIAACSYHTRFSPETTVSERVLMPAMAAESHGMEDARLVRFVEDDGAVTYYATYTAFDGVDVSQQLLRTTDFVSFASSPLVGPAAANKGLALFPRRVRGRFTALSRHDRECNAIASSESLARWDGAVTIQAPERGWDVVQLGNCGSPIETEAGWLVLTHGVGPMRTYSIGALLLDLDDPSRVVSVLPGTAAGPDRGGAGRIRAQRRLLLRRSGARWLPRRALRDRRHRDRLRGRRSARAAGADGPVRPPPPVRVRSILGPRSFDGVVSRLTRSCPDPDPPAKEHHTMPDRSPNHANAKKAAKSLKEKRLDKKTKKAERRVPTGLTPPKPRPVARSWWGSARRRSQRADGRAPPPGSTFGTRWVEGALEEDGQRPSLDRHDAERLPSELALAVEGRDSVRLTLAQRRCVQLRQGHDQILPTRHAPTFAHGRGSRSVGAVRHFCDTTTPPPGDRRRTAALGRGGPGARRARRSVVAGFRHLCSNRAFDAILPCAQRPARDLAVAAVLVIAGYMGRFIGDDHGGSVVPGARTTHPRSVRHTPTRGGGEDHGQAARTRAADRGRRGPRSTSRARASAACSPCWPSTRPEPSVPAGSARCST